MATQEEKNLAIKRCMQDPIWVGKHFFGINFWKKQREIAYSVWNHKYTTVKATHGVGKTHCAAGLAVIYLFSYPGSIVITTAPTARQVEMLLWQEIRKNLKNMKIELDYDITPSSPYLKPLRDGVPVPKWYAQGFSTNDADKFQGIHEERVLMIFDEAAGISQEIFTGVEGCITNPHNRLLLIGNPTSISGGFFDSFKDETYNKFTISSYDTPNFIKMKITRADILNGEWEGKFNSYMKKHGKVPYPFLVSPDWVGDKYKKWCKGGVMNSLYLSKVEGEFVEQNSDSLIPVSWVELAFERWQEQPKKLTGTVEVGVDVAEFGDDESAIAVKVGDVVKSIKRYKEIAVMDLAGIVAGTTSREDCTALIKVDTIGIGTGVEGRLKEDGFNTLRVAVSQKSKFIDKNDSAILKVKDIGVRNIIMDGENFANLKAQMYWYLRERLDPDLSINPNPLSLPPDPNLLEELTQIKYKYTSKGKIQIEPKTETKKRLGRSPDVADAVAIVVCPKEIVGNSKARDPKIRIIKL